MLAFYNLKFILFFFFKKKRLKFLLTWDYDIRELTLYRSINRIPSVKELALETKLSNMVCHKGSVPGSVLYHIYIKELPKCLRSAVAITFADDSIIYKFFTKI